MSVPRLSAGRLPLGRWTVSADEVEATFVAGQSHRREQIWADWLQLTQAVREVVGVLPAAWLGGSFLSDKDEPGDLDSVYVIESWRLLGAKVDLRKAQFLQAVADNQAKQLFGLQVDCFVLDWVPLPGTTRSHLAAGYRDSRGYWDDLWSRERSSNQREDSVPRRGYLEVILDGYV